jgi:hypothetical protein
MKRISLFLVALGLTCATHLHAMEPVSFAELSLLLRAGETPLSVLNEVSARKLLQPLTAAEEARLRANGATPSLIEALRSPDLLAPPDAVAAYHAHHPIAPAAITAPAPNAAAQPIALSDRFSAGIEAAKNAPNRAVQAGDAFSLDQLEQAKAKAQREQKPLGFIMMWGQMLDAPASTRLTGGNSALLHFCEAFKDSLVLVFVRHETELQKVPKAVSAGYSSPDEGGVAPNMAVVDSTARELIVEIPCGGFKGTGADRDAIFQAAGAKIQQWLSYHPAATATPAPH